VCVSIQGHVCVSDSDGVTGAKGRLAMLVVVVGVMVLGALILRVTDSRSSSNDAGGGTSASTTPSGEDVLDASPTRNPDAEQADLRAARVMSFVEDVVSAVTVGDEWTMQSVWESAGDELGEASPAVGRTSYPEWNVFAEAFSYAVNQTLMEGSAVALQDAAGRVAHRCHQTYWDDAPSASDEERYGPRPWVADEDADDEPPVIRSPRHPYPGYALSVGDTDSTGNGPVAIVQRALQGRGFVEVVADGVFGPRTEHAVKSFQREEGLTADGVVGPATWAALVG
jgi:hypothetical protein